MFYFPAFQSLNQQAFLSESINQNLKNKFTK